MSILDITLRDILPTARHAAFMAYARLRNRARRALRRAGPPVARREVLGRFPGARNGQDVEMFVALGHRITFPYLKTPGRAAFIGPDTDIWAALRGNAPEFGERVYELRRITRADHFGPTEAEYREVSDAL